MKRNTGRESWAPRIPLWGYALLGVALIGISVPQFRQGETLDLIHGGFLALQGALTIFLCVLVHRGRRVAERWRRELENAAEQEQAAHPNTSDG